MERYHIDEWGDNIVKLIIPNVIYRLNVIPILSLFCQNRKANYKIYMALRGGPKSQNSLEKRDKTMTHISHFQNSLQNFSM